MVKRNRTRLASFVAAGLCLAIASAADKDKQTIERSGIKFEAPAAWKSVRPGTSMRLAELVIAPVKPDDEPAQLQVFAFPGGAGSVQDNVKRWQNQFVGDDGKPPKITRERRRGKNVEVTYAEVAGRYTAPVRPGSEQHLNKPGFRLLGAIVETPQTAYFLKIVGPDKTVKEARDGFDALISSITVGTK